MSRTVAGELRNDGEKTRAMKNCEKDLSPDHITMVTGPSQGLPGPP